jgi:hypothetical protein
MTNIIKKLFCLHKWEKVKEIDTYWGEKKDGDSPTSMILIYICKECGKFKKIEL